MLGVPMHEAESWRDPARWRWWERAGESRARTAGGKKKVGVAGKDGVERDRQSVREGWGVDGWGCADRDVNIAEETETWVRSGLGKFVCTVL